MKTKIKRHSRAVISVILAISMLVSCMMVGIIATDAAYDDSAKIGDDPTSGSFRVAYSGNSWNFSDGTYALNQNYGASGKYYVEMDNPGYFALSTPSGGQYRPDTNGASGGTGGYSNGTNAWNAGATTNAPRVKICIDTNQTDKWKPYVWVEAVTTKYYLQYAVNDSDMSSATVVEMTDGDEDGIYTATVNSWSNTKINYNVSYKSSPSNDKSTLINTTSMVADTGIKSVDEVSPKESSGYMRCQVSLVSQPQNVTFSFDPTTGNVAVAGSIPSHTITAGGNTADYKLTVSNGVKTISNDATTSGTFNEGETLTVKIYPKDDSKKVSSTSPALSSLNYDKDGKYFYGTFTVPASDTTVTASLANKTDKTVSFSAPGGHGTVSAKLEDGTELTSGGTVPEYTNVIFTATPDDGYGFNGWSAPLSSIISPYTYNVTGNTTVTASFALDGYQLYYKDNTTPVNMKEMDNGWYVSSAAITKDKKFTLFRTGNSTYVDSENGNSAYVFKSDWLGPDKNLKWVTTTPSSDGQYYTMNTENYYLLYDPINNTLWVTDQSDGLFKSYEIYIKDGTIRNNNGWGGHASDYGDAELLSDGTTSGVTASVVSGKYDGDVYKVSLTPADIRTGVTLHIKATVKNDYKTKFYVKGFDVNGGLTQGLTSQEFDDNGDAKAQAAYDDEFSAPRVCATNPYSDFTLTLSAEDFPDGKIEVTPIYFPLATKDDEFVRFYAYDFTEDVKRDWGGSLAVYPYIRNTYDPYGKYPGQLMAFEDGVYYADIPATYTHTKDGVEVTENIQGLTMNNYVWDTVHYDLFYGSNQSGNNYQTYDYNEFSIINDILHKPENHDIADEDIIFSFKYKTKDNSTRANSNLGESTYYKDSATDDPSNSKDYRNGFNTIDINSSQYHWEDLTDFYHNRVDIFGEMVDDAGNETKQNYNPIRIVSNGYDDNAVGYYATAWALYAPVDASGKNYVWSGAYDHYQLFEVMGGQGRSARDYPGESYLIDPKYENRIKLKYGVTDSAVVEARKAALKIQMIANGEKDKNGNVITEATSDDDIKWPDHIMDCEKVPVKITYEYNVQASKSNIDTGDDQQAYRSDGRWYYSSSQQLIKSNVIVEVANSKKGPFVRDYFQDDNYDYKSGEYYDPTKHTGKTTGVKAYFTNSNVVSRNEVPEKTNVSGNTEAWAVSDGKKEHDFLLKAEEDPNGEYEFLGWYRLTENGAGVGYTHASDSLEFEVEAKTNDVYVARFVKIPSGNLMISHALYDQLGEGEVDCKARVEILTSEGTLDSTGATVIDSTSYPLTTDNIKVTSKYIKYDNEHKNNKIRITLETTSQKNGKFLFDKFWDKVFNDTLQQLGNHGVIVASSVSGNTAKILVTVGSLFDTTDPDAPVQTVKSLPFYSQMKLPQISYKLDYTYESAIGKNPQYGEQSVHVEDYFTDAEFAKYVVWDDELVTDDAGGSKEGGWYKFNPETYVEFLASKCPYEKNIRRDLTWDYTQITKVNNGPWYYYNQGQFKFAISASDPLRTTKRINFIFPYYVLEYDDDDYYLKNDQGLIEMLDKESAPNKKGLNKDGEEVNFSKYLEASTKFATPYTKSNSDVDSFVKAPEIIYDCSDADNPVPKYFQYWSVQTVPSNNASNKPEDYTNRRYEVARCYNLAYNFSAYQDYIVEAKYGNIKSTHTHEDTATITFAENGRNQWNDEKGSAKWDQGDRIFSNFIISFDRADKIQLNTLGAGDPNIKTGVVFEQLDTLSDFNQRYMDSGEGDWTVQSEMTYFQKYSGENTLEAAEAADHGKADAIKHIRKEATSGTHTYMDSTITNTNIDNKNRIEFTKAFANINTTDFAPTTRKNYVYRAYAYMQEADGSVTISTPVYFQFYDIATIANATQQTTPAITG